MAAATERSGLETLAAALEPQPLEAIAPPEGKKKRNPAPGVRVVGGRIYDPENGKTCHQCRQKTTDFAASCKQVKKKGTCTIKYCKKCLQNRYGENAEEATGNNEWTCPKCRGICNCSFCRKKTGKMPTGIMSHLAKASGCTSVHDLLAKGSDEVAAAQAILKANTAEKQGTKRARETDGAASEVVAGRDGNVDNALNAVPSDEGDENVGVDLNVVPSVRIKKKLKRHHSVKKNPADEKLLDGGNDEPLQRDEGPDASNKNIVLPKGTLITNVAGVELDSRDVGAAIQFYEFCRAFAELLWVKRAVEAGELLAVPGSSEAFVCYNARGHLPLFFQIRKGQPEKILKNIVGGRELRLVSSHVADFHITLLSVIHGRGNKPPAYTRDGDSWVIDVGKWVSKSTFMSKELPSNCLNGVSGYKKLSPSCKLRVLNFLCDETLWTDELKKWIEMQNEVAAEPMNAAREKARAAKLKEKELKERLKERMNKATLMPTEAASVEEKKHLISQIKEAQEVKRATLYDMATMENHGDGFWTKPLMIEKGLAYWRLEGYCDNATILMQEYGDAELIGNKEKWFMFNEDEEKVIEEYKSTRSRR